MRKPTLCICENKDADQLPGNRKADQRLCFRFIEILFMYLNFVTDGVYLDVSVLDSTLLAAVWGVNIPAFQQELNLPSSEISQRYHDKTMFDGKYMEYEDLGQYPYFNINNT